MFLNKFLFGSLFYLIIQLNIHQYHFKINTALQSLIALQGGVNLYLYNRCSKFLTSCLRLYNEYMSGRVNPVVLPVQSARLSYYPLMFGL